MSKGRALLQPLAGVDNQNLDPQDVGVFITVMREVQSVTDWSMLSSYLGIDRAKVEAIRKDDHRAYTEIQAYVKAWLITGKATWAMLAAGLRQDLVRKKAVGNAIKAKYRSDWDNKITEIIPVPLADGVDDSMLVIDDVTAVMVALQNVTEWTILSILLGVKESTLRRIKEDNKGDSYRAEQAIVEAWIGDTDNPSWAMLVTALKDDLVGMNGIGMKIEQQHLKSVQPPSQSLSAVATHDDTSTRVLVIPYTNVHLVQENELPKVFEVFQPKAHQWFDIGKCLNVDFGYRRSLRNQGIQSGDTDKLEKVLQNWFASRLSPVTWENLARVSNKLQFKDTFEAIMKKKHLQC